MENKQKIIQSDEVDLQELAVRIIQYFTRHLKVILASILIGIVASIIAFAFLPKVYESKMILLSDILTESYGESVTESLNNLINAGNIKEVSNRLSLSLEEASKISKIEIRSEKKDIKKDIKKDKEDPEEPDIVTVTADVEEKDILPKLQSGIIQFLRNNEFVRIRIKQRKEKYSTLIDQADKEIRSLDSLKKRLFAGQPVYSKSAEMLLVDPTNIYSKIMDLTKYRIDYKNRLELADSIQLVEGFTAFEKPASPKLSVLLLIGFFAGFFLSIGFLILKQLFKLASSK